MRLVIPMHLASAANLREHWRTRANRVRKQREAVAYAWPRRLAVVLPATVTLTRVAPRMLDGHDNLRSAFKAMVDECAHQLGIDDRDERVRWLYAQEQGASSVVIEVQGDGEVRR